MFPEKMCSKKYVNPVVREKKDWKIQGIVKMSANSSRFSMRRCRNEEAI